MGRDGGRDGQRWAEMDLQINFLYRDVAQYENKC
jgi:hypothetical protein